MAVPFRFQSSKKSPGISFFLFFSFSIDRQFISNSITTLQLRLSKRRRRACLGKIHHRHTLRGRSYMSCFIHRNIKILCSSTFSPSRRSCSWAPWHTSPDTECRRSQQEEVAATFGHLLFPFSFQELDFSKERNRQRR
jgi:hypothetical protein